MGLGFGRSGRCDWVLVGGFLVVGAPLCRSGGIGSDVFCYSGCVVSLVF